MLTHMKTEIKKLPKSLVEITGIMEVDDFEGFRKKAMKHLAEHADLPGFRKGHIPEATLASAVGEMGILEEMAEMAIESRYTDIILTSKIDGLRFKAKQIETKLIVWINSKNQPIKG